MHIGIIMDGNRRWARGKGLPGMAGHKYGADNLEKVLDLCVEKGVEIVTVYALSTENLKRKESELKNLFALLEKYLSKTQRYVKKGIRMKILGNPEVFPEKTREALRNAEEATQQCDKMQFNIALNYGGRDEIVRTARKMQEQGIVFTEDNFDKHLDTEGMPSPDLIIRTGGDRRLSNFLLWQAAYATLYFTDVHWPAFDEVELDKALSFLKEQKQNYGR